MKDIIPAESQNVPIIEASVITEYLDRDKEPKHGRHHIVYELKEGCPGVSTITGEAPLVFRSVISTHSGEEGDQLMQQILKDSEAQIDTQIKLQEEIRKINEELMKLGRIPAYQIRVPEVLAKVTANGKYVGAIMRNENTNPKGDILPIYIPIDIMRQAVGYEYFFLEQRKTVLLSKALIELESDTEFPEQKRKLLDLQSRCSQIQELSARMLSDISGFWDKFIGSIMEENESLRKKFLENTLTSQETDRQIYFTTSMGVIQLAYKYHENLKTIAEFTTNAITEILAGNGSDEAIDTVQVRKSYGCIPSDKTQYYAEELETYWVVGLLEYLSAKLSLNLDYFNGSNIDIRRYADMHLTREITLIDIDKNTSIDIDGVKTMLAQFFNPAYYTNLF